MIKIYDNSQVTPDPVSSNQNNEVIYRNEDVIADPTQSSSESLYGASLSAETKHERSPLNILQRIKYAYLLDDNSKANYLKSLGFPHITKGPDGDLYAGKTVADIKDVDPGGIEDFFGDLADLSTEIPVVAGAIFGATLGAGLGSGPGAVYGSGVGAGAGTSVKRGISYMLGSTEQDAEEVLTDVVISAATGMAGESIGLALKSGFNNLMPKVYKSIANSSASDGQIANAFAKGAKILTGLDEDKTFIAMDFPDEVFAKGAASDNSILNIVKDVNQTIKAKESSLGSKLGLETEKFVNSVKSGQNTSAAQSDLLEVMKGSGILRQINGEWAFDLKHPSGASGQFLETFKRLGGKLSRIQTTNKDTGFVPIIDESSTRTLTDLFSTSKRLGSLIDKFENSSPEIARAAYVARYGDKAGSINGIHGIIDDVAMKTKNTQYLKARNSVSTFKSTIDELSKFGFKADNPAVIENITRGSANMLAGLKQGVSNLDQLLGSSNTSSSFLRRMNIWDAANSFARSNPNMLRLNAVTGLAGAGVISYDSPQGKLASLGAGILLGTPYGLGIMIKNGSKITKLLRHSLANNQLSKSASKGLARRSALQILAAMAKQRITGS